MKVYFSLLKSRILGIFKSPVAVWKSMKGESGYIIETVAYLFAYCATTGFSSLVRKDDSWAPETFIPFCALLLSSVLVRFVSPDMRKTNWEGSLNLITYSYFPFLLAFTLSYIFGKRQFILPVGLVYSLILSVLAIRIFTGARTFKCFLLALATVAVVLFSMYAGRVFLS
ncbi:MAG: hypothetical protein LBC98_03795 [Prevotellaceae bacterium]|nr:hypothetical protein [Prevotellaceae bacterium]